MWNKEQIEKMTSSEILEMTFTDCEYKCCKTMDECYLKSIQDCKQHLLNSLIG